MVTCLSGVTDCHGQLIDNFRYWMLQMAMMDKILEVCPNTRFTTAIKPVLRQIRLLTGLNVGGKTRNIAIQLVL